MSKSKSHRANLSLIKNPVKVLLVVLLSVVVVVLVLELTSTTHFFHKNNVPPVIKISEPAPTNMIPESKTSKSGGPTSPSTTSQSKGNQSSASQLPLYAPYGDFVSNHRPNLSGSPAPSEETSVCNTTPGAQCFIKITKGNLSTSLPVKTTDSNGSAYWYWDVSENNLSTGSWQITAVALLNGQTKSTVDPLSLEVSK